jgi:hypothetical protein
MLREGGALFRTAATTPAPVARRHPHIMQA